MSSLECAICMDGFPGEQEVTPEPVPDPNPAPTDDNFEDEERDEHGDHTMCALRCGHLFHRGCVKTWFNQNRGFNRHTGGRQPQQASGYCPICKGYNLIGLSLRLYPTYNEGVRRTPVPEPELPIADPEQPIAEPERTVSDTDGELNTLRAAHAELQELVADLTSKLKASEKANRRQIKLNDHLSNTIEKMEAVGGSTRRLRSASKIKPVNK